MDLAGKDFWKNCNRHLGFARHSSSECEKTKSPSK